MKFPQLSRREWTFAIISGVIVAIGVLGMSLFAAVSQDAKASDGRFWLALVILLLGPPLLVGATSLLMFGARRRIKNAFGLFGIGVGIQFFAVMAMNIPGVLHAPRLLALGSARGAPAELANIDAAWVDVTPAFVDLTRTGRATSTHTDSKGHSSTRESAVAPILTAHGELDPSAITDERVELFLCQGDLDDVRAFDRGNGTISGRMQRADFLDLQAMEDAKIAHRADVPKCVVPGRGWGVFWIVLWVLIVLVLVVSGSALLVAVKAPQR